jgi:hypothetical protein
MESDTSKVLAVERFGAQEKVLELYRAGSTINSISKELAKEGIKISDQSISKWIKKQTSLLKESKGKDLKSLEKFEMMTMDY